MLVLDIETQNSWSSTESISLKDFKISYVGAIETNTGEEFDFWEDDMDKLKKAMEETDIVCGYNIFGFDMPIIANYLGQETLNLPQLDLMVAVQKQIGYRAKLDDLSSATFGSGKIGKGTDAVEYWLAGELEKLKEYCMKDVQLTLDLYNYGVEHGTIKYYRKDGFIAETPVDWELGKKLPKEDVGMISMF